MYICVYISVRLVSLMLNKWRSWRLGSQASVVVALIVYMHSLDSFSWLWMDRSLLEGDITLCSHIYTSCTMITCMSLDLIVELKIQPVWSYFALGNVLTCTSYSPYCVLFIIMMLIDHSCQCHLSSSEEWTLFQRNLESSSVGLS